MEANTIWKAFRGFKRRPLPWTPRKCSCLGSHWAATVAIALLENDHVNIEKQAIRYVDAERPAGFQSSTLGTQIKKVDSRSGMGNSWTLKGPARRSALTDARLGRAAQSSA